MPEPFAPLELQEMQDLASSWTTLNFTLGSWAAQLPFHLTSEEELKLGDGLQTTFNPLRQPERKSTSLTPLERTCHFPRRRRPRCSAEQAHSPRRVLGSLGRLLGEGRHLTAGDVAPQTAAFSVTFSVLHMRGGWSLCSHLALGAKGLGRDNRGNGTPGRLLLPLPFAPPPLMRLSSLI